MNLEDLTVTAEEIRDYLDTTCPMGHGVESDGTIYPARVSTPTEHRVFIAADERALYEEGLKVQAECGRWWLMTMVRRDDESRVLIYGRDALPA
ncbi:hypothetical protein [Arsenicicoccus bolidensis]|uniref:hypothetical protein n=1 Tax=Arsenicicoccus bolidensis TaxID=229480 RepID=UPI0028AFA65F|nr:hypothetical protein [Arsenicicoccus bolidensis]